MKRLLFIVSILFSLVGNGGREAKAQNVTILPSGITPAPAGAIPRISYAAIMALPSPQGGDLAFDVTFNVMRMYTGSSWPIIMTNSLQSQGSDLYTALDTKRLLPNGVATDRFGNIYLTGDFSGTVTVGGITLVSAGITDIFIAKFNSRGLVQWLRRGGGTNSDTGNGIVVDGNGGIYVTGNFGGAANFNTPSATGSNELVSAGGTDIFIAKYNSSGTLQWLQRGGGTNSDSGNGITVNADLFGEGKVYVTGTFRSTANFNTPSATGSNELISAGSSDIFIAKYNESGTLQWLRRGGGTGEDIANGITVPLDVFGSIYVTGSFSGIANFNTPSASGSNELITPGTINDVFIAKYNSSGTVQWLRRGGSVSQGMPCFGNSIDADENGNVYVTGSFSGIANFNTPSATGSNELVSVDNGDIFIVKYNSSGTVQWLRRGGGAGNGSDRGEGITVDSNGNVYVTGRFLATANFNTPSATGSNELISTGQFTYDIFIAKYNGSGALQWLQRAGGLESDDVRSMAFGVNNMLYIVGTFRDSAQFGQSELNSDGSSVTDGFVIFMKP